MMQRQTTPIMGAFLFLLLAMAVVTILSLPSLASAAVMVTPSNSSSIGGTTTLNASGTNLANCTWYAGSAATANTTWTRVAGPINNHTASAASINTTFNTAILEDAHNYQFNVTCVNMSSFLVAQQGLTSSIIVDNTLPTAPSALQPEDNTRNESNVGTVTFSATVNAAETIACNMSIGIRGTTSSAASFSNVGGTHTGSTCTVTKTFNSRDIGVWHYFITATDGTNSTNSATQHFIVVGEAGGAPQVPKASTGSSGQKGNFNLGQILSNFVKGLQNLFGKLGK